MRSPSCSSAASISVLVPSLTPARTRTGVGVGPRSSHSVRRSGVSPPACRPPDGPPPPGPPPPRRPPPPPPPPLGAGAALASAFHAAAVAAAAAHATAPGGPRQLRRRLEAQ